MKINRKELLQKLEQVKSGLTNKEVIEQADSFVFHENRIYTYNDEISISVESPIDVNCSVKAKELLSILSKMKGDEIRITTSSSELIIKDGKARAGIKTESEISMPLDEVDIPEKWKKIPKNFMDGIKFCSISYSKDMSKPALTCLHINKEMMESCNGYSLTRFNLDSKLNKFLIPGDVCQHILKHNFDRIAVTKEWIHFKEKELIFSCRTFSTKYPKLDEFIKGKGSKVTLPNELPDILDKASVFSAKEFEQDNLVELSLSGKKLVIRSEGDKGWFEEKTIIKGKSDDYSFSINPNLLKQILKLEKCAVISDNKVLFKGKQFTHVISTIGSE